MTDDIVATLLSHVPDEPMRTHYTGCEKFHPACAMVLAADEIKRLRAEMLRYGDHTSECVKWDDGIDCTCGWDGVA